jgi:hypothetical protein
MAETVALYLRASRLNHLALQLFALAKIDAKSPVKPDSYVRTHIEHTMCHGSKGLKGPGLTSGADDEWAKFGRRVDEHIAAYKSTPWEVLARRIVLLSYEVYVPQPSTGGGTTSRPKPSSETQEGPTKSGRPSRESPGKGGSGTTGGTTTKD